MAELQKAYLYILKDSLQNAEMVRDDIINLTIELSNHPERYPIDKLKNKNDGTWRYFQKYHYRVSYKITKNEIRIVRLRHTSRSPLRF